MVGWALRPCDRRENLDRNCRLGYLVVGWASRPFNRREKLDGNCSLGYLVIGWVYACVIGGRI